MADVVRTETAGTGSLLRILIYTALVVAAVWFLSPIYVMIVTSIKSLDEIRKGTSCHCRHT